MKTFYYLPNGLIYDSYKLKFINISFELAIKYLKLIYKESPLFQDQFLFKLDEITDLNGISRALKLAFDQFEHFTRFDLERISDKNILDEANLYLSKQSDIEVAKKPFLENYISKIKTFLDNEEINKTNQIHELASFSNFKKITEIEEYILNEKGDEISFEIPNVKKLIIQSPVKKMVCNRMNLKGIVLNEEMAHLDISGNEICEIYLNKNLLTLEMASNNLKELKCNENLKELLVANNQLEQLELNASLEELICNGNNLNSIALNTNLKTAHFLNTSLNYIKINENLRKLSISHPKNKLIEIDNSAGNNQVVIEYYIN